MEKTSNQKIQLGLFVLLGSILFIGAIYFVGNKQDMFNKTIEINALFSNINGLQKGNNVRFSGINVGTVQEIEIVNDSTIRVEMKIEQSIMEHIKKDAVASITSDGLVGNMIVNIIPGNHSNNPVQPGDTILSLNKVTTEELMKTLSSTSDNANVITANLAE